MALMLAAVLSANVFAASNKPFSVSTPATISAGSNKGIPITVADLTKTQQLGSLEIDLSQSPGFSFSDDGSGSYGSVSQTGATVSSLSPTLLVIQNLNLRPGQSATISITDVVAPGCVSLQWTFTAQQANQWTSGNGANYLTLQGSQPISAGETCVLAFNTEPTDAGRNAVVTGTPLTPTGTPVSVEVLNGPGGSVVPVTTGITLTLNPVYPNPNSGAELTGATATTIAGIATFPTLSVNNSGSYNLTATAAALSISTNSDNFRIWDGASTCGSGCNVPLTTSNGETVAVGSTSSTGAVGASLDIVSFDCSTQSYGGVPAIPGTHTTTWTSYNLGTTKTTTMFIPDSVLNNATDPLLEVHYMVCMSAPYVFPVAWTPSGPSNGFAQPDPVVSQAMTGTTSGWYRGLLPDCQDLAVQLAPGAVPGPHAPCVATRIHGVVGGVSGLTVTVLAAAGDPMGR